MKKIKSELLDCAVAIAVIPPAFVVLLAIKHAPDAWFQGAVGFLGPEKFLWLAGAAIVAVVLLVILPIRWLIFRMAGHKSEDRS
jgi:membrane protein YdbS with pleckstrin-like domain